MDVCSGLERNAPGGFHVKEVDLHVTNSHVSYPQVGQNKAQLLTASELSHPHYQTSFPLHSPITQHCMQVESWIGIFQIGTTVGS